MGWAKSKPKFKTNLEPAESKTAGITQERREMVEYLDYTATRTSLLAARQRAEELTSDEPIVMVAESNGIPNK